MMKHKFELQNKYFEIGIIAKADYSLLAPLILGLNENMTLAQFEIHTVEMLKQPNYDCIGIWENEQLIACCGYWLLYKFYNGKHVEPDNVGVLESYRNFGLGKILMAELHKIATELNCNTSELNAYVSNYKAHKFYIEMGYKILGFHFQKGM
jgi:GNAT superfamily N-acetyltransferase